MLVQCLICVPQDEASAIGRFQALREACRAAVRRQPTLAAALLFNGSSTLALLEGEADSVHGLHQMLRQLAPDLSDLAWLARADTSPPVAVPMRVVGPPLRALQPGRCRLGYLAEDGGGTALQRPGQGAVERIQLFMGMLAASDLD